MAAVLEAAQDMADAGLITPAELEGYAALRAGGQGDEPERGLTDEEAARMRAIHSPAGWRPSPPSSD